jgi:hypothetical protein
MDKSEKIYNENNMLDFQELEVRPQKFEYSVENPPPLEVLESKIFAVHATPILPKDGILKARH